MASSTREVQRSAHWSLLARLSLLLPALAVLLTIIFKHFQLLSSDSYLFLTAVALSLLSLLSLSTYFWFRKAIAPRRGRRGREVHGKEEAEDEESDDEEVDDHRKASTPTAASLHPPLPTRAQSLPASSHPSLHDLSRQDDHDRLSDFWHPPRSPTSPSTPTPSPRASPLPAPLYYLASSKYISSLSQADFSALYTQIDWRDVGPDVTLYERGADPTDGCFILVSGRVSMHTAGGDDVPPICQHGTGELIGEEAIFEGAHRWLTCRTVEPTQLIVMPLPLLRQWKAERPEMIVSFVKTSLARQWRIAQFSIHHVLQVEHDDASLGRYQVAGLEKTLTPAADWLQGLGEEFRTRLSKGQTLFSEGSHTHQSRLFLIRSGHVMATRPDHGPEGVRLGPGTIIDPLSFFADTPHHYTITAADDCELLFLTPDHMSPTLAHPALYSLVMAVVEHMRPTLQTFTELGLKLEWRKAGECLFIQRQRADDLYLIISGRVRVLNETKRKKRRPVTDPSNPSSATPAADAQTSGGPPLSTPSPDHPDSGNPILLGPVQYGKYSAGRKSAYMVRLELGRGDCCGEMAFLGHVEGDDVRHSASAVCVRDTEVVRVSRRSYETIVARYPRVLRLFSTIVSRRLEQIIRQGERNSAPLTNKVKCVCIALIPLPSAEPASLPAPPPMSPSQAGASPFSSFCHSLAGALSPHGLTLHIRPALVDSILGPATSSSLDNYYHRSKFTSWLSEQEEKYNFLLFEGDSTLTPWTSLVVRTSDYSLLIADPASDPAVSQFEWKLMWEVEQRRQKEEQRRRRSKGKDGPSSAFIREGGEPEVKPGQVKVSFSFSLKDLVLLHPTPPPSPPAPDTGFSLGRTCTHTTTCG